MDASFEEDLEKTLREKKKEFKELQKETQHVVQNCFRPEVIEFVKDVNVKLAGWKFESPARFQMVVTYKRFQNFIAYLQHWCEKKVLDEADVKVILEKPSDVEPLSDYVQPVLQSLSPEFENILNGIFENSVSTD